MESHGIKLHRKSDCIPSKQTVCGMPSGLPSQEFVGLTLPSDVCQPLPCTHISHTSPRDEDRGRPRVVPRSSLQLPYNIVRWGVEKYNPDAPEMHSSADFVSRSGCQCPAILCAGAAVLLAEQRRGAGRVAENHREVPGRVCALAPGIRSRHFPVGQTPREV